MMNQVFNYKGDNITFQLGNGDILVNATQMAKPFNKEVKNYLKLVSTNELINAYVNKNNVSKNQLVTIKQGSPENGGGTWMHEDIALDFSQWLSIDFKLWCNDRLKELFKHGFTATPSKLEDIANNPDLLIELAQNLKKERAEKLMLQEQNRIQQVELVKQAPKVAYVNKVLDSNSTYITNQIAKELGTSAVTLNRKLKDKRIIYKQNGTYLLYQGYQNKGYTKTKTYTYTDKDGLQKTSMQLVWTEKGRAFIHHILNK